jgi:hypothetical protein
MSEKGSRKNSPNSSPQILHKDQRVGLLSRESLVSLTRGGFALAPSFGAAAGGDLMVR